MVSIDAYNSRKIKVLSFIMAYMVLVIHSVYDDIECYPIAHWFQECFRYGFCRVAVPMFFMLSGFLFYLKIENWIDCIPKIKKRIRTLLIPYLLWNTIFVIVFAVLYVLPLERYVNNSQIIPDIISFIKGYDIIGLFGYLFFPTPINVILWFIRDLFIFAIISPVLYFILDKYKWLKTTYFVGLVIFIIWAYNNTVNGLFFFSVGGFLALNKGLDSISEKAHKYWWQCLLVYVLLSLIAPVNTFQKYTFLLLHISGVLVFWGLYDFLKKDTYKRSFEKYSEFSFFIYCAQYPLYNILKKGLLLLVGGGTIQYIILFLLNPIIMVGILIAMGVLMKKFVPQAYGLLTGSR